NVETMVPAVKAAVESGRVSLARIEQSVRRILDAKWRSGLARRRFVDLDSLDRVIATREHRASAQRMMDRAVTLVRNQNGAIPLRPSKELRLLQVNVLDNTDRWINNLTPGPTLTAELRKRFPKATSMQIDDQSSPEEIDLVRRAAELADAVVVGTFVLTRWAKGTVELPAQQVALIRQLARMRKPFVLVAFGSPYVLRALPETPSYLAAYDTHPEAQRAAAAAIAGEIEIRGTAPVNFDEVSP
ncbi:MAG TPA: glycoside hydrolase family 3 C-terminal domain-containing protein, partial [Thermoanaerobaculia bacterium]